MTPEARGMLDDCEWVKRSLLYREFLTEREGILRHKWLESEKAGRDIGFDQALVIWVVHHRAQWCKQRRLQSTSSLTW